MVTENLFNNFETALGDVHLLIYTLSLTSRHWSPHITYMGGADINRCDYLSMFQRGDVDMPLRAVLWWGYREPTVIEYRKRRRNWEHFVRRCKK